MTITIALDKLYLVLVAIWLLVMTIHGHDLYTFGKAWRKDFKEWLKSYKQKPVVRIVAESIISEKDQVQNIIYTKGRVNLYISVKRIEMNTSKSVPMIKAE